MNMEYGNGEYGEWIVGGDEKIEMWTMIEID